MGPLSFYEVASELENFHTLSWLGYLESLNHSDLIWAGKPCQIVGLISKNMTNATSKRVWLHCVAWICWTNEKNLTCKWMCIPIYFISFKLDEFTHVCSSLGLYSTLICIPIWWPGKFYRPEFGQFLLNCSRTTGNSETKQKFIWKFWCDSTCNIIME